MRVPAPTTQHNKTQQNRTNHNKRNKKGKKPHQNTKIAEATEHKKTEENKLKSQRNGNKNETKRNKSNPSIFHAVCVCPTEDPFSQAARLQVSIHAVNLLPKTRKNIFKTPENDIVIPPNSNSFSNWRKTCHV